MPTEAEFEYALQARGTQAYPWGDEGQCDFANAADVALKELGGLRDWIYAECNDRFPYTAPVGGFRPNRFGLLDLSGNAWEWTVDCWSNDYQDTPPLDGSAWLAGDCDLRVLRGGGWNDRPEFLRSAFRLRDSRVDGFYKVGFRLARTLRPLASDI